MGHIRHNIIFSVLAHSILLAAALLIGGSSEIRKVSLLTISIFDERDDSFPGKQAAQADPKLNARAPEKPGGALKAVTKASTPQESTPQQDPAPLPSVKLLSDVSNTSIPGVTGMNAQGTSLQGREIGPSSVNGQSYGSSSGEADAASTSRRQTAKTVETGADASLKQRIRDTLQNNLVYPYIARKRRMEGTVLVDFRINQRGMAENVRVLKGSGHALLDSAAMETVVKSSPFPLANYLVEVPITYRLTQN